MVARTASVTVKLLDQLSAPARIIGNSLRALRGDMNALAGARLGIAERIKAARSEMDNLSRSISKAVVASTAGAYALSKAIKRGTSYESTLISIRQKSELTAEQTRVLDGNIGKLASTLQASKTKIASTIDFLLGMGGIDQADVLKIIPDIHKTAAAYQAETTDMAKAAYVMNRNMKVPIERLRKGLDSLAQSSSDGGFEFKAMAQYLPSLFSQAASSGIVGLRGVADVASALQVIRESAGDDSEASTYLRNVLQKIGTPETAKKFKKAGIDIRKEIDQGLIKGVSPLETLTIQSQKALKKKGFKIGDLFEDQQAMLGITALMDKLDRYRELRQKSEAAEGNVARDYAFRMDGFQAVIDRTAAAFEKLAIAISDSITPALSRLADVLNPMVGALADFISANKEAAGAIMSLAGAATAAFIAWKGLRLLMAGSRLLGLLSSGKLLDYLAPKGGGPAAAAAAGATAGKLGTATKPGAMTPSQLQTAKQGVANMNAPATALGRLVGGLKNGVVGGLTYYFGTKAIDAGFEALPTPDYPAGYDPNAEMNMGIVDRFMRMWNGYPDANSKLGGPEPIQPADASGDALKIDGKSSGVMAGTELGQGIKDGLAAARPEVMAAALSLVRDVQTVLASAGLSIDITPRVAGLGSALRGIHADAGI